MIFEKHTLIFSKGKFSHISSYQSSKVQEKLRRWHKKEKQIFSWFIVAYCVVYTVHPNEIVIRCLIQARTEWEIISRAFFGKDAIFLKYEVLCMLKNNSDYYWSKGEDEKLEELVREKGTEKWKEIS